MQRKVKIIILTQIVVIILEVACISMTCVEVIKLKQQHQQLQESLVETTKEYIQYEQNLDLQFREIEQKLEKVENKLSQ